MSDLEQHAQHDVSIQALLVAILLVASGGRRRFCSVSCVDALLVLNWKIVLRHAWPNLNRISRRLIAKD
ncbi:MAG: hypothetical protein F4Z97_03490 [Gammaproteobacteria bacterium]|nr:hypothetical protein [Gammaproteobacteria bacterium]